MPDLKYAVLFTAIDNLSSKLGSIGSAASSFFDGINSGSQKIAECGERMADWGVRIGITTALLSEGATKMHEWADAISEPAMGMEHSMATMAAMTSLASDKLGEIKDHAVAFSDTHPGVTVEQWADGFTHLRGVYQDTAKAMAAEDVSGMLARFGIQGEESTRLLSTAWATMGVDAKTAGDQLSAMMQQFGPTNTSQLAMTIGKLGGAAMATNTPFSQLLALAGKAQQMMPGRGMMMFTSLLQELNNSVAEGKTNIDVTHGYLGALQDLSKRLAGYSGEEKISFLKSIGISANASDLIPYLGQLDAIAKGQAKVAASADNLGKMSATAYANVADQTTRYHQNLNNLADAFGTPALGFMNAGLTTLIGLTKAASDLTEHHSLIAKAASLSIIGVGDAAYYGLQGLSAMGTFAFEFGKSLELMEKFGAVQKFVTLGTYAWTVAQWALDSALWASGIPEIVIGVAALGVAAYEIYEHWGAVTKFFKGVWDYVAHIDWRGLGITILKGIGEGLLYSSGLGEVAFAARKVAGLISDHFAGHSPPPLGPLHDIGRIRIVESIAERIKPGPMLSAVGRTAAVIAMAAPMMGAGPAMAGGITIIDNSRITIGAGADSDAFIKALREHRYELVQEVRREVTRRERTNLS